MDKLSPGNVFLVTRSIVHENSNSKSVENSVKDCIYLNVSNSKIKILNGKYEKSSSNG